MSAKTKIVVLHLKELIYTGIFAVLGIVFIVVLIIMFLPKKDGQPESTTPSTEAESYEPGTYSTSLSLNGSNVIIEVDVAENSITDLRLINMEEAVATMYPLIQPSFDDLANQILELQSLDAITYSDENRYTYMVLLDAIDSALEQACPADASDSTVPQSSSGTPETATPDSSTTPPETTTSPDA